MAKNKGGKGLPNLGKGVKKGFLTEGKREARFRGRLTPEQELARASLVEAGKNLSELSLPKTNLDLSRGLGAENPAKKHAETLANKRLVVNKELAPLAAGELALSFRIIEKIPGANIPALIEFLERERANGSFDVFGLAEKKFREVRAWNRNDPKNTMNSLLKEYAGDVYSTVKSVPSINKKIFPYSRYANEIHNALSNIAYWVAHRAYAEGLMAHHALSKHTEAIIGAGKAPSKESRTP